MSCVYYSRTKCFKNCKKNISTDGKVMAKIKVACFFWDTVYILDIVVSFPEAVRYNVVSDDVTITSLLRSDMIILGINFLSA